MALLITKQEYKNYAGITSSNEDAKIDNMVESVSKYVQQYCNRDFIMDPLTAYVEYFNGGEMYFQLGQTPILNIASVQYSSDYGQTWTSLVLYTDYAIDSSRGTVHSLLSTGFTYAFQGYRVTYTGGYAETPVDIRDACYAIIDYQLKQNDAVHGELGTTSSSTSQNYINTSKLPASIVRVLDLNRQYV